MIRVLLTPRIRKTAEKLPAEVREKAAAAIAEVAAAFGNPHTHRGLGLRKIARRSCEIRVHRQWRIVLLHLGETLTDYDVMTHDGVALRLRGQRKRPPSRTEEMTFESGKRKAERALFLAGSMDTWCRSEGWKLSRRSSK